MCGHEKKSCQASFSFSSIKLSKVKDREQHVSCSNKLSLMLHHQLLLYYSFIFSSISGDLFEPCVVCLCYSAAHFDIWKTRETKHFKGLKSQRVFDMTKGNRHPRIFRIPYFYHNLYVLSMNGYLSMRCVTLLEVWMRAKPANHSIFHCCGYLIAWNLLKTW